MQHLIGKNDPDIFSAAKENQYFDRKSARKDTKEISRHICALRTPRAESWLSVSRMMAGLPDSNAMVHMTSRTSNKLHLFAASQCRWCGLSRFLW